MKSEFNKSWVRSVQPRKQVKFRANAPNHIKRKFMGSPLDKELRTKYGRRTIEVRKGDEVKIMRGKFSGKQGKVGTVDVKNTRIQVEGVQRAGRAGGEKLITWFHPSKVKIIILNSDDARRMRRSKVESPRSKENTGAAEKTDAKEEVKKTDEDAAKVEEKTTKKKTVKKAAKEEKK